MFDSIVSSSDAGILLENIINLLNAYWNPILTCLYLVGFTSIVIGLVLIATGHKRGSYSPGAASFLFGILLLNLVPLLKAATVSCFNTTSALSMFGGSWEVEGNDILIKCAVAVVQFVGFLFAIKGIWKIKNSIHAGDGYLWHGVAHFFGGIACLNITLLIKALGVSLGGPMQTVVNFAFN